MHDNDGDDDDGDNDGIYIEQLLYKFRDVRVQILI